MSSLVDQPYLKTTFWSYALDQLDSEIHKELIIKQILNHGDKQALNWLKETYSAADIRVVITKSMVSEWSKKSLSLWTMIYGVTPRRQQRFG